jgi:hypothetical protein
MAAYRVVSTVKQSSGHSEHIVAVGVGDDPNTAVRRCTQYGRVHIRSAADAVTDNLDSLRRYS